MIFFVCDLYKNNCRKYKVLPSVHFFLLFKGKCCNIFEEGLGKVAEDFTKNCSTCDFHYCSDESGKTIKA